MISKWRITSLIGLCIVSTLTCGFSSWIYVVNNKADVGDIDVNVGNIIDSRDIIQLDTNKGDNNSGISCFDYCKDGFVNDGVIDVNDGYLNIYLKLNIKNIKKAYGNPTDTSVYSSLYLGLNLNFNTTKNFSFISESYINPYPTSKDCGVKVNYTVDAGTQVFSLTGNNSIENGKLTSSYNGFSSKFLSQSSSNSYFYVTFSYCFSIDYKSVDYCTAIYPNLQNSSFDFSLVCGGY